MFALEVPRVYLQRQQQQQQQQDEASSLIQLNPMSSTLLTNHHADLTLVHNPYYVYTDPSYYCLAGIDPIHRNALSFHRQVFLAASLQ